MSQVTIYFGVAPAVAPMVGGFLFIHASWHAIFWFLTGVGVLLWLANWRLLPRRCMPRTSSPSRSATAARLLAAGLQPALLHACTGQRHSVQRHVPLRAVGAGVPRRAAASGLGQFFWFFTLTIAGIMAGSFLSGRLAGRIKPKHQIRHGFVIMLLVSLTNVTLNLLFGAAGLVGAAADRDLRLRLGADGAGGHADGARPRA